jgi:hypothetical protein
MALMLHRILLALQGSGVNEMAHIEANGAHTSDHHLFAASACPHLFGGITYALMFTEKQIAL